MIHLSGESEYEVEKISEEVNVLIKAKVEGIRNRLYLRPDERDLLLRDLIGIRHRTYL